MRRAAMVLAFLALTAAPARALETDPFASWDRPLSDAADAVNEKINADIARVLGRIRARGQDDASTCASVRQEIRERQYYMLIPPIELWAMNTPQVERATAGVDSLYRRTSPLDPIRWMPLAPTIEIAGVRLGTDKLSHFLIDGAATEAAYRRAIDRGADADEALEAALSREVGLERGVLGQGASGVFSIGDIEAGYQGMMFFRSLCDAPDPALVRDAGGWRLARPIDVRRFVTPAWDESWQPNIYTAPRWVNVEPVMRRHCGELASPAVRRRWTDYAARDRGTPVHALIDRLVGAGKLPDPRRFSIESVCAGATEPPAGSGR